MRISQIARVILPAVALLVSRMRRPLQPTRANRDVAGILEMREGLASYYGPGFDGKVTASGTRFDMNAMVAAHPSYPFGTVLRVTNVTNRPLGRASAWSIVAQPEALATEGVIIDVSYGAAGALNFVRSGRTRVRVEVLSWGN